MHAIPYMEKYVLEALLLMNEPGAGIEPTEPGFNRFSVKPQLGPLKHVETVVPTLHGPIALTVDGGGLALEREVPDGTTADVDLGATHRTFRGGSHRWTAAPETP